MGDNSWLAVERRNMEGYITNQPIMNGIFMNTIIHTFVKEVINK